MSYDVDLVTTEQKPLWEGNITCNVAPMLIEAGLPNSLRSLHGRLAADAEPDLARVTHALEASPERFLPLQPENKWGMHKHLLPFMQQLLAAVRANPTGQLLIS